MPGLIDSPTWSDGRRGVRGIEAEGSQTLSRGIWVVLRRNVEGPV